MTLPEKTPAVDATIEDRSLLIRESLRNAIIDRRLAPGTKLSEAEVGALFDVSRTVARAALQILAFEGLVKTERNRGAFVSTPSPEEARQIFASRRLIEPGIIAAAVERITPADIVRFQHHLAEEAQYMNAALSGNVILQRFMDELVARSSLVVALYGRSGISSCGHNEHLAILELVAKGDAKGASDLMLHHLDHIEADLDLQPKQGVSLRNALAPLA